MLTPIPGVSANKYTCHLGFDSSHLTAEICKNTKIELHNAFKARCIIVPVG